MYMIDEQDKIVWINMNLTVDSGIYRVVQKKFMMCSRGKVFERF